jgi:hypothetical protein
MYLCCLALDVRLSMLFVYLHVYEKVVRAFTIYGACLDDLKMTVRPELVSRTLFPSQLCASMLMGSCMFLFKRDCCKKSLAPTRIDNYLMIKCKYSLVICYVNYCFRSDLKN